ncbi:MAG: sugar transferase [Verrucomicrobiota bacterium]
MIRLRHKLLIRSLRLLDQAMLAGGAAAIIYLRPSIGLKGEGVHTPPAYMAGDIIAMLLLALGWVAIFDGCVRYRADRFTTIHAQLRDLVKATTLASFWLLIISAVFSVKSINNVNIFLFWGGVTVAGVLTRLLVRMFLMGARKSGYNYRFLLVIGANERSRELAERIERSPELGYKLVGFVAETDEAAGEWRELDDPRRRVLGTLDNLKDVLTSQEIRVDEMMVCLPVEARFTDIARIVKHARDLGVVLRLLPDLDDSSLLRKMHVEELDGECVITMFRERLLFQLLLKRMADIAISVIALTVLSPLMFLVAVIIKITSPGPVFFSQKRVGMNKRAFKLFKFRSMVVDAEAKKAELAHLNEIDGPAFKMAHDPRITRIGAFIRKTSIDELPQLLNVLRGEMSLVGPRPPLPEEVDEYEWLFRRRLSVKPGITCVWQVSGRNNISFERWMEMDHEYIENWSLLLDFKILLQTIPAVLLRRGAS